MLNLFEAASNFKKKIVNYRKKHYKIKEFTFKGWLHNGVQVIAAGIGADLCANHALLIETVKPGVKFLDPFNNIWYWYFTAGFLACVIICCFGLWDMYKFALKLKKDLT